MHVICMSDLNKYYSPFDIDVIHIEQCDFHVTRVILTKTHPEYAQQCQTRFD